MNQNPTDEDLRKIYDDTRTIAVVGASSDPDKSAHGIPWFLQSQGYRIIPVTPSSEEVWGERAYPVLTDVPDRVDVVDVFRPAEEAPDIARQAVEIDARVLWLQEGIVSEEAAEIARGAGMQVVMDLCMGVTYRRLEISRP